MIGFCSALTGAGAETGAKTGDLTYCGLATSFFFSTGALMLFES
jgi:hypothetical protein